GLPSRAEGHGIPPRAVEEALAAGARLIVTCDTGVTEHDTVALARARGCRVVVTDHHDLPSGALPEAEALVNPKLLSASHPLHELSGAGVAFLVAQGLAEMVPGLAAALDGLLDLVAIGLVADLATLSGDVRYLVQRGIAALRHTSRPGLLRMMALGDIDAKHADEDTISYGLGPRLNAAGRLASAEMGVRLLMTREAQEAEDLAGQLEHLNRERRARTEAATAAAEEQLRRDPDLVRQPAIVIEGRDWDGGVLGLVASSLAKRYDRPAVVVARHEDGVCAASARSVDGIDIHAAIGAGRALLLREGGHPMAAGFSLRCENLPEFCRLLMRHLSEAMARRPETPPLGIAADLPTEAIDLALAGELKRLAPYGMGNPQPVIAVPSVAVARIESGQGGAAARYHRLYLAGGEGASLRVTVFGEVLLPTPEERIDVAVHVRSGYWHGQERLEVLLVDWRPEEGAVRAEITSLHGDLEVVDWRREIREQALLLDELRGRYGQRLAVWAEGPDAPTGALRRTDLREGTASALAVAFAPASPEDLRAVLLRVRSRVVFLLPPIAPVPANARDLLRQVAGMLQVALRDHGGRIDVPRMASRVGQRDAAILAALRALEADGHVRLSVDAEGSWNAAPAPGAGSSPDARRAAICLVEEVLTETAAFRRAYASMPVSALVFSSD
ncbi:MAG TPA: DHHA1 domain-containing protein, partial [Armatimonadota bacterium]|nr:DHHA1 domain-containing protein [Armatimonadota bacterium]